MNFGALSLLCSSIAIVALSVVASSARTMQTKPDVFHIDWDTFCATYRSNCDSSGNPHYAPGDADMIANTIPLSPYDAGITKFCAGKEVVPGSGDCAFVVGVYDATRKDPLVKITLTEYENGFGPSGHSGSLNGSSIYIPRNAMPQPVGDGHINVRQPDGVMCELWRVNFTGASPAPTPGPISGRTLDAAAGACGGPDFANDGTSKFFGNAGAYAAHIELTRGMIRAEDLAGSNGDGTDRNDPFSYSHAVYGAIPNNHEGHVWPASASDGRCTTKKFNGAEPVEGMVLYLDAAGFNTVKGWKPPIYLRPLQRFLGNLHKHGMLDLDSSGCSDEHHYSDTLTWGPQAVYQATGTSIFDTYLSTYIAPHDSQYVGKGSGTDQAIYKLGMGAYEFRMLLYQDVPGLKQSNFHWLDSGCGQIAVSGYSTNGC